MVDQASFCSSSSLVFKGILNLGSSFVLLLDCMNLLCNFLFHSSGADYLFSEKNWFIFGPLLFSCKLVAHGMSPSVLKGACLGQ